MSWVVEFTHRAKTQKERLPMRVQMENGKRGIGKERARILAKALNVSDYRLLL